MNRYSPPEGHAPLPAEVHTDRRISTDLHPPRPPHVAPPQPSPFAAPVKRRPRRSTLRTAILCLVLVVGLAAVLAPALRTAVSAVGGAPSLSAVGQAIVRVLLQAGLPPTDQSLLVGLGDASDETDTCPSEDTAPSTADGTASDDMTTGDATAAESDTIPSDGTSSEGDETANTSGSEVTPTPPDEPVSEPTEGADTTDADATVSEPSEDTADEPPATDPDASAPSESSTVEAEPPDTDSTEPPAEETATPVPDGCIPITGVDMSDPDRGAGYIINTAGTLPASLPAGRLWSTADAPTVLIVNTHPYEGYGDGADWYDPTAGGLAQTDSPNAADGVVALGAQLARYLRGRGVTVIHLRVAVSAGESAGDVYERTEELIRYYCRLYPDIGLVLDLRRSAELTDGQTILRTEGTWDGAACAQLRISVSGGRTRTAVARDLAVALALREGLWGIEPSLSRPVWVKSGGGLVSDLDDVAVLTLELGSAGNTYGEAEGLVAPIGRILSELILKTD